MTSVVSPSTESFFHKDVKGYKIEGKNPHESQMKEVLEIIKQGKLINEERLDSEVNWFYGGLGLDRQYFETTSASEVAGHIVSLYSAKCLSQTNGTELELRLQENQKHRAMFVGRSMPGQRISPCVQLEHTIEENYLGLGYTSGNRHGNEKKENKKFRLQCYRTTGGVSEESNVHLRLYFLSEPQYANPKPTSNNIEDIADTEFLRTVDAHTKNQVQGLLEEAATKVGPVVRVFDTDSANQKILIVIFQQGTTHSFFSGVTDVYHSLGMKSSTKYVEQFANGMTMFHLTLKTVDENKTTDKEFIQELIDQTTLTYMLARTSLTPLLYNGTFNIWEHTYAYAAWKFAFQFLGRQNVEFIELAKAVKADSVASALLDRIKNVIRKEAYTEGRVLDTILEYPHLVKDLYKDFELFHKPNGHVTAPQFNEELWARIRKTVMGDLDQQIFKAFLTFNQHILKTNFYKSDKLALSFRLDPRFLSATYPVIPYGMFFVVGAEFRGFHVRFRDIARGGIRIIRSVNLQAFTQNVTTVFDENYNLAATQDRKNKDIPEGGSKGTILLSADHQDKSFTAFKKYIDSLLDLLSPNPMVVDHFKKEEILFMGPDEGTADMMNWASQHAKERGFKFWKAFTTGKSRDRGGIPHDLYGMTTRSIHQYVLGILEKLNLKEEECTKFQTGGPDGDLGSNEIKISKDKTIGIVDGSGVLYDPKGLDKQELLRCATARIMARSFDKSKLSPQGFFVDVEHSDVKLPDGSIVASGLEFRNNFHVNSLATSDIFVPCGGRPESINLSNVNVLIDKETKKPRFRYIVEGANLFFTQEARLLLEKQGVVIFKDASANKGGVTSSSLEVLAALSLTDEEFDKHMSVKETEPQFYKDYVEEVQKVIESNARMEFECIWEEHKKTGTPRAILSDVISNKIVELSTSIGESDLWNNVAMRRKVLREACPKVLLNLLNGVDKVLERVPESYLRAIFARYLASRYVYKCGIAKNPEFAFFAFLQPFIEQQ